MTRHGASEWIVITARRLCLALGVVAALAVSGAAKAAAATELVMFEEAGCPWCRAFDREIAPAYPKTEQGRQAPLRRVDIRDAARSGVKLARPVNVTPTFVLSDGGVEVGRITGYPGDDFFWGLLDELLARLPRKEPKPRDAVAPGAEGGLTVLAAVRAVSAPALLLWNGAIIRRATAGEHPCRGR